MLSAQELDHFASYFSSWPNEFKCHLDTIGS